jgi:hypothetical protein
MVAIGQEPDFTKELQERVPLELSRHLDERGGVPGLVENAGAIFRFLSMLTTR